MSFFVWTVVGIAVGCLSQWLAPRRLRTSPTLSMALGIGGAWGAGLFVGALQRSWIGFGLLADLASVAGAIGAVLVTGWIFVVLPGERDEELEAPRPDA